MENSTLEWESRMDENQYNRALKKVYNVLCHEELTCSDAMKVIISACVRIGMNMELMPDEFHGSVCEFMSFMYRDNFSKAYSQENTE